MQELIVTVVIPVYNNSTTLWRCVKSLYRQGVDSNKFEIILIDDGSTDDSYKRCKQLCLKYKNITLFQQVNKGVSAARNIGISNAKGKYIFFLDGDDVLSKNTLRDVSEFFDTVYQKVDLVTYRIETIINGKMQKPHFRYNYLNKSGIYDLREEYYIGQTTMNIAIKNCFEKNVLFDEKMSFSEDQKYCCDVLKEKLKMGFCNKGCYLYFRDPNSSSGLLQGACFVFEQSMNFFEKLFEGYNEVPATFQGLYINDLYWKMASNILFPYHYTEEKYDYAIDRMKSLLKKCSNKSIIEHPNIDYFEKFYFLRMKNSELFSCSIDTNFFGLSSNEKLYTKEHSVEIVITKLRAVNGEVEFLGFIKSVFFQFFQDEPILVAVENHGALIKKINLYDSSHSFYQARERTQKFKAFRYRVNPDSVQNVSFEISIACMWFPVHFYFMPYVSLSHKLDKYQCQKDDILIRLDKKNNFTFVKKMVKKSVEIWLYYDCAGVTKDNGYYQFLHDIKVADGICRYYIITDRKQLNNTGINKHYVIFGSKKHKKLLLACKKIISAYIEYANLFPFREADLELYSNKFNFEIIYLQHGVLHAVMPWKYSPEKIAADKVVVTTVEEAKLFVSNGFLESDLIKVGMPRFELLNKKNEHKKKILFAPSWRQYLIGEYVNNNWEPLDHKFEKSSYLRGINQFLNSQRLYELLEISGYSLEVKLHPIFECYKKHIQINNKYIKFSEEEVKCEDYDLFITDFSSYVYYFAYLDISVILYIPDFLEFQSGMNGYRKINIDESCILDTTDGLIDKIKEFLIEKKFIKFNVEFFDISNCREKIYKNLVGCR